MLDCRVAGFFRRCVAIRPAVGQNGAVLVAVGNQKGGVGKTTLAVNLACSFAGRGAVVIVDADPQATALEWAEGGNLPARVVAIPLDDAADPATWARAVAALEADAVVIDLPPQRGAAMAAALALSDVLVVPVTPSGADLRATERTLELVAEARRRRGGKLPRVLLVPSKVDRRTAAGREIEGVLHDLGEPVGPMVAQRSAMVDAFSARQWVGDYARKSPGHVEIEAVGAVVRRLAAKKG